MSMETIMIGAFIADLLIAFGVGIPLCVRLKKGSTNPRAIAFAAGCALTFTSSILLMRWLGGPVLFGDCSSTAGSRIAVLWVAHWNPWGALLAIAGMAFSAFGRGRSRIVPFLSSAFLFSFSLFLYRLVEMK
jgi:hypothetical protein